MTISADKMNRICSDCNREPIACFNRSGFCDNCRSRNFYKSPGNRAKKMEYYYKQRNVEGKRLTLCGDKICEEQKRKVKAHPSETYIKFNKCVKCDVLWPKDTKRCPHCKYPVRMKPRNKKHNRKLSGVIEKGY